MMDGIYEVTGRKTESLRETKEALENKRTG